MTQNLVVQCLFVAVKYCNETRKHVVLGLLGQQHLILLLGLICAVIQRKHGRTEVIDFHYVSEQKNHI